VKKADEIWNDTDGKIDMPAAGVGTGGRINGVSAVIKKRKQGFKTMAEEPRHPFPAYQAGLPSGQACRLPNVLKTIKANRRYPAGYR